MSLQGIFEGIQGAAQSDVGQGVIGIVVGDDEPAPPPQTKTEMPKWVLPVGIGGGVVLLVLLFKK